MLKRLLAVLVLVVLPGCAGAPRVSTPAATIAPVPEPGAQAIVDWNQVALKTTAAAAFDPPRESRSVAMVQLAVYGAVNATTGHYPGSASASSTGASPEAAAIAAAYAVLVHLYADQQSDLGAAYSTSLDRIATGKAKSDGVAAGETAAGQVLALRAADGADVVGTVPAGEGPGRWIPTPPKLAPALDAAWGKLTPFTLETAAQFRPAAPYSLTSDEFARDFAEVKDLGSANSTSRTAEQTAVARFWLATASQIWNQPAQQLVLSEHYTIAQAARLFATLDMAIADAAIAAWDAKFTYLQWRPITAIRGAASLGSAKLAGDPEWAPLLPTPPFPDYVCGHSALSGAAETVLDSYFGTTTTRDLVVTSAAAQGAVRRYTSFAAMDDEVVNARVWAGIHWRTSCVVGRQLGSAVGAFALQRYPRSL